MCKNTHPPELVEIIGFQTSVRSFRVGLPPARRKETKRKAIVGLQCICSTSLTCVERHLSKPPDPPCSGTVPSGWQSVFRLSSDSL